MNIISLDEYFFNEYISMKIGGIKSCVFINIFNWVMVFNATFNNISVISWRLVVLVEETRVPSENH